MSRLSANILYNFFGQGLVTALGFVAMKFVFTELGDDALGIIYFALTLNGVLTAVMELGVSSTTVREVSAHLDSEPEYIGDLIRTASLFYWTSYVTLSAGVYLAAPALVERWVNLSDMDIATATTVLRLLGIGGLVAIPRSLYMSLFRGIQRMEFNNLIDVSFMALQQLGTIAILALGGGLLPVVYWLSASFGLSVLFYLLIALRFFRWQSFLPGFSLAAIKRNIGYSRYMMSISLLSMVHLQADKLIVSKLLPLGFFGYYVVAFGAVSRGGSLVTSAVVNAAFPSLSSLFGQGARAGMMARYTQLRDLVALGTVPIFSGIVFFALPLFGFVFNPGIARMLLLPVVLLAVGSYMNSALSLLHTFSLAVGMPEISARANFIALFVVLPLTALLIYQFGLTGAALSWVAYHLFAFSYTVPRICRRCLNASVWPWYRHFLRIGSLVVVTYGLSALCLAILRATSLLALSLGYCIGSLLFLVGSYHVMGDELRGTLRRFLRYPASRPQRQDTA